MTRLSVVIQAGGQSSRMGEDKALVPFMGVPLIEYILRQVEGLGDETLIITNHPEEYERFGLPLHGDVYPGMGALGGLYSAIYHAKYDYCLVLACDMPFINQALLEHMIELAPEYDAVIPRLRAEEYAEPFRAIYRKICLEPILEALERGRRRIIDFFDRVDIRYLEWEEIEAFDPLAKSFFNINTREDFIEAERLASGEAE